MIGQSSSSLQNLLGEDEWVLVIKRMRDSRIVARKEPLNLNLRISSPFNSSISAVEGFQSCDLASKEHRDREFSVQVLSNRIEL